MATWLLLVLSLLGWKALSVAQDQNSHQSFKVTWKLQNGETYEVLNQTTATHPVNTWWPNLYFHLKELMETSWACAYLQKVGFYACPGHKKDWIKTWRHAESSLLGMGICDFKWWLVEMECGQAVGPGHDDFCKSYHLRHVEQAIYW